ncbi:MAG: sigma-70 family RNA polymerase sigma factor [Anaerovoracaceae bacterium]
MMFVLMTSGMTDPDREKFNKIYHLYASFVYRVALKELSETELAQDCTQAAFERIIKYMDRLEEPDSPQVKSYIYKTVLSTAANMRRREEKYVTKQDDELFYLIDRRGGDDPVSRRAEVSEILRFAEQHLSVDEKIILSCRYDGRNSYREAAGILGISEAACRKKMQRIRQKSQTHLEQISEERKGEKT